MKESKGRREIRKLRQLIREYKKQGYDIYANYSDFKRPRRIGNFVPDLIVKKDNQEIIIEITTDESFIQLDEKLKYLSDYAAVRHGTNFSLIFTNPRPILSREEKSQLRSYLLRDLQRSLLHETKRQYNRENFQASFVVLYQLLESLLKETAVKRRVIKPRERVPDNRLLSILFENKILSQDDYLFIKEMFYYRDKIVHRFGSVEKERLLKYINFVSILLKAVK